MCGVEGAEVPVAELSETRHDELGLVQMHVEAAGEDAHPGSLLCHGFEALGARDAVDEQDVLLLDPCLLQDVYGHRT